MQIPPAKRQVCLNAGQSSVVTFNVYLAPGTTNDLPSGSSGLVSLTITEIEEGIMSDTAVARVTRHRLPDSIQMSIDSFFLRPGGDKAKVGVIVLDDQQVAVADGTEVFLSTTLGTIADVNGSTQGGVIRTEFTSGSTEGTAIITAQTFNNVQASIEIDIVEAPANQIALTVDPTWLLADGQSTAELVAIVYNRFDQPMAGQTMRIGVEGDGQMGTIDGKEVVNGTTDNNGRFVAIFTSGEEAGNAGIRAELLVQSNGVYRPVRDDRQVIRLSSGLLFLPVVYR